MKIAILSTSATLGGAAIASARLADALNRCGQDVTLFTLDDINRSRSLPFLMERAGIFAANGFNRDNLFKVSTASFGRRGIVDRVLATKPDIIVLGWINQGMLSLGQIHRLGSRNIPLVWIMHDMWNITGICHHSLGCNRYTAECGNCPFISSPLRGAADLSHRLWLSKNRLYRSVPLKFVAVSHWLANLAHRSKLLRDNPPEVIPNVFPMENFHIAPKEPGLIVMGAARLDDPIKGLHHAVGALNRLQNHPTAHVRFFGELRNPDALKDLKIPYKHLGAISETEVADLMSRAQVVLSSSLYESLGLTLIEGQASGAMPVSFDRGGQADIIDHFHSGYLAPFGDEETLARGVVWALDGNVRPEFLREEVERKFSAKAVAERMISLFNDLKSGQICSKT